MIQEQRSKRRARRAGLKFVNDFDQGYTRRRCGKGFAYFGVSGQVLRGKRTRKRIDSLVIPPAWEEVWICPKADGHLQARGRDEAGRLQYIYHPDWESVSASKKFDRMARFACILPRVRRRVRKDLNRKGLPRERVLAAVIRLIDKGHLRVGSDNSKKARGATTLLPTDVDIERFRVSLDFPSKSGQRRTVEFLDKKLVSIIERCEELDGQFLFNYITSHGNLRSVSSTAVNGFLREIANEQISAKDFRTWSGSTTALAALADLDENSNKKERKSASRSAIKATAAALGNTVAVCKQSYVHPMILASTESGELPSILRKLRGKAVRELTADEVRFKEFLQYFD